MMTTMNPHHMRRAAAAALLAVVLASCGGTDLGTAPDGAIDLEGDYTLVEGRGPDGEVPLVEDSPVTLSIEGEEWGGTAACNHYGGTVTIAGDDLTVHGVFQTEMACVDDRIMESERLYLAAFQQVDRYERDGDRLLLLGDDVELVFVEVPPEPDAALVGTTWVLTSLLEGTEPDGAVSSVVGEPTLEFGEDGTFLGETGCNRFGGDYRHAGDSLVTSEVDASAAGCPDEIGAAQEEHVLAVLADAEVAVIIDGRSLRLTGADGRGLDYRAADGS